MQMQGVLEQVETVQARAFAVAAASASDTVLYVNDVTPLLTFSGECTVDIGGVEYTATPNSDDDSLTLDPALSVAVAEDDPVTLVPAAESTWAWVSFPDDDDLGDLIVCLVPHYLKSYRAMSVGPKSGADRVAVVIETQPEPVVVNVPNEPVLIDAGDLDPDSTVPPAALTDGEAPSGSPVPVLEPFGVGGLRWSVTPVANVDPVRFRIYADTVDPPTIDAAHLVGDSSSTSGSFSTIDGARLLPDDPAVEPDPVYAACIEYDADGDAPVSATSDPASPRRATTPDIASDWVYANNVEANQISGGKIDAGIVGVGDFIDLNGPLSKINIWKDADHSEVGTQLGATDSVFRGRVEADSVDVTDALTIHGEATVSPDGSLTLGNGVADPTGAPILDVSPLPSAWPALTNSYVQKGICWDAANNQWLRLIRRAADGVTRVQPVSLSGVAGTSVVIDAGSDANSITVIGSNWFVMVKGRYGTGYDQWRAIKFDFSGNRVQVQSGYPGFSGRPCVGTDGTNLLVAKFVGGAQVNVTAFYAANIDGVVATYNTQTGPSYVPDSGDFSYVGKGSFDFGASRFVINAADQVHVYTESGGTLTDVPSKRFTLPATTVTGGFTWDGTAFFSTHSGQTVLYAYNGYEAADAWFVAYTDTGSGNHTKASPQASVLPPYRWSIVAALGPAPTGATTPAVYALESSSLPAVTTLKVRSETPTGRTIYINPATAGGSTLGTDSNTFGAAGSPGAIESASGGFEVDGSGAGVWPLLGSSDQKSLSSDANPTSTTNVNMTSLDMSVTVIGTSSVVWVQIQPEIATAVANTLNIVELLIDGNAQTAQLRTRLQSANDRYSGSKTWRITGLSAGSHTIAFRTRNSAGSTDATIVATHTLASYRTNG